MSTESLLETDTLIIFINYALSQKDMQLNRKHYKVSLLLQPSGLHKEKASISMWMG